MTQHRSKQVKSVLTHPAELNEARVQWAESALLALASETGADVGDAISDLLADLMHWCDQHGQNFEIELGRARDHYDYETEAK